VHSWLSSNAILIVVDDEIRGNFAMKSKTCVPSWLNTGLHPVLGFCPLSGLGGSVHIGGISPRKQNIPAFVAKLQRYFNGC
jgi:hypothetical protein